MSRSHRHARWASILTVLTALFAVHWTVIADEQGDDGGIAAVPAGSAFSFQGKLNQSGQNFTGQAEFAFTLYDAPTGGVLVATASPAMQTIAVTSGLFTTTIDFGTPAFVSQSARWVSISVRVPPTTGSWVILSPRQRITPAPVALYALNGAGLTLPFSATASNSGPLFTMTNSGTGGAMRLNGNASGGFPFAVLHVDGGNANRGIYSYNVTGEAIVGDSFTGSAFFGYSAASGFGMYASTQSGTAVLGEHRDSGNYGTLGSGTRGVYGRAFNSPSGPFSTYAVDGENTDCIGRLGWYEPNGEFPRAIGVYGSGGFAGLFDGPVEINGPLSVSHSSAGSTGVYSAVPNGKAIHAVNAVSGHAGYFEGFTFFSNNIGLNVVTPTFPIHHSSGARLTAGGVWTNACDANLKQDFQSVDTADVLQRIADMPIQTWSYKAEADVKHIGPTAQDFRAAFGLGSDGVSIGTVDADGVALAAIQALNQQLKFKEARVAQLEADMLLMRQQVDEMRTQNRTFLTP